VTAYRREIDGLRALAVLPVILFHAGFSAFSGGYVGVDVFFVISGYLITSLLVGELSRGSFSLLRFYERRARRILPALFLVMAVCLPMAWLWLVPADIADLSESMSYVAVFASNVLFARESGYFDTAAELKPLLHTWSLAVEEQYYLLFPLLLAGLWRAGRLTMVLVLVGLGAASLYASITRVGDPAAVYLLTTRGWELAVGALIALTLGNRPLPASRLARDLASGAGAAMILMAVFMFSADTPFPGAYALIPTVGTALILMAAVPDTQVGRVLSSRPLVAIGLISYSAYLWHQPLLAFARHATPAGLTASRLLALCGFSLALAYVSWRLVEQPFRNAAKVDRRSIFALAIAGSIVFGVLGMTGTRTDGFAEAYVRHRLSAEEAEFYRLIQAHTNIDPYDMLLDDGACRFWSRTVTPEFERRLTDCRQRFGPALVVLGDSHAMNIYNIIVRADVTPFVAGLVQGGCRPDSPDDFCQYTGFDDLVARRARDIRTVIFHQSGSYLLEDRAGDVDSDRAFDDDAPYILADDGGNLNDTVAYLMKLQRSVDTIWLGPFAEGRLDFRDLRVLKHGPYIRERSLSHFQTLERDIQQRAADEAWTFRNVSLHDLLGLKRDSMLVGSCLLFRDTDHFSACGEELIAVRIRAAYARGLFDPRPPDPS
jgi:peptidoglycan/LPS O-acetylase OafA/YrhL